jgi:hypothetical protein
MSNDIQEALGMNFVAADYPDDGNGDGDFKPLTPGWYPAEIEKTGIKRTNADDGRYLNVQFCILGEVYSGRKVFEMYNIDNPSTACQAMGRKQLGKLCCAVGLPDLGDSQRLIGKTVMIKTAVKAAVMEMVNGIKVEKYKADTEIKEYKAPGAATTSPKPTSKPPVADTVASAPEQGEAPSTTSAPGKMPWE